MGNPSGIDAARPSATSGMAGGERGVVILAASDLRDILSPDLCLAALETAYRNLHARPEDGGQSIGFKTGSGKFHVKAGLSPRTHTYFAAKINGNFPDNPRRFGAPTIQGLIVLCACDDGRPVAILQSGELTGRRTAAATALAAKHGARQASRTLAMIGCGAQSRYQAAAICGVRPIAQIVAFDRDESTARAFAAWAKDRFAVAARVSPSLGDAIRESDICVTSTTSRQAIVEASMVPQGCFLAAVGADNPDKQELDPKLFAQSRILVDDLAQCAVSGDLAHAIRAGVVQAGDVAATLADLAAGAKPGRTHDGEVVLFDSTGTGVQDVAAAAAAYEVAKTREDLTMCDLTR